ncbi:hypothetical protein [Marmoricola sp. URHB0036]|uniref:hypothetical protein n=1 Tax=Marmoricola sp. URHB0036 TaxID=1298863 RepID=UPI00048619A4|nr:hypothetical protein [Marmoricola sp. URHB0036]
MPEVEEVFRGVAWCVGVGVGVGVGLGVGVGVCWVDFGVAGAALGGLAAPQAEATSSRAAHPAAAAARCTVVVTVGSSLLGGARLRVAIVVRRT